MEKIDLTDIILYADRIRQQGTSSSKEKEVAGGDNGQENQKNSDSKENRGEKDNEQKEDDKSKKGEVDDNHNKIDVINEIDLKPKIALAFSGGGVRAAQGTRHFMHLIDFKKCSHIATLSGSTWFMMHYLYTGKIYDLKNNNGQIDYNFDKYDSKLFSQDVEENIYKFLEKVSSIKSNSLRLITGSFCHQKLLVLLAVEYFGNYGWFNDDISLESFRLSGIQCNESPIPIMTCYGRVINDHDYNYNTSGTTISNGWCFFEITPDTVKQTGLNNSVETKNFGVSSSNSKCEYFDLIPNFMALCGSADNGNFDCPIELNWNDNTYYFQDPGVMKNSNHYSNLPLIPLLDPQKDISQIVLIDFSSRVNVQPDCHLSASLKLLTMKEYSHWDYTILDENKEVLDNHIIHDWYKYNSQYCKLDPWKDGMSPLKKKQWIKGNMKILYLRRNNNQNNNNNNNNNEGNNNYIDVRVIHIPIPSIVDQVYEASELSRKQLRETVSAAIEVLKDYSEKISDEDLYNIFNGHG